MDRGRNRAVRIAEWRRAADVLEKLKENAANAGGVGSSCGWDVADIQLETTDFVSITGERGRTMLASPCGIFRLLV